MQKISPKKCFKTTNFDRFHQEISLPHVFQIPLPNSEHAKDNVLAGFGCMFRIYLQL